MDRRQHLLRPDELRAQISLTLLSVIFTLLCNQAYRLHLDPLGVKNEYRIQFLRGN
jgi:hypothetical protein